MCNKASQLLRYKLDMDRYRRYSEEKARIPQNLSPAKYEAEIKKLIKKYKI